MNRRDAIGRVALIMGGTLIGAEYLLSGCKPKAAKIEDLFNTDHVAFLNEVADTILPTTSTPGAKDAKVGDFMAVMVRDCYEPADQDIFLKGLDKIDDAANKKFSKKFMDLDATQRSALLTDLDKEQQEYSKNKDAANKKFSKKFMDLDATQRSTKKTNQNKEQQENSKTKKPKDPNHYFRMIKELTLLGYFTSEVGCTKALRYVPVPGRFDGCIPYKKGDKAWALS